MRNSIDDLTSNGAVFNGYDYMLGVWVVEGVIQNCAHPQVEVDGPAGYASGPRCCNARKLRGKRVENVPGHEMRYGEVA